jgi:hypothetical protein
MPVRGLSPISLLPIRQPHTLRNILPDHFSHS